MPLHIQLNQQCFDGWNMWLACSYNYIDIYRIAGDQSFIVYDCRECDFIFETYSKCQATYITLIDSFGCSRKQSTRFAIHGALCILNTRLKCIFSSTISKSRLPLTYFSMVSNYFQILHRARQYHCPGKRKFLKNWNLCSGRMRFHGIWVNDKFRTVIAIYTRPLVWTELPTPSW